MIKVGEGDYIKISYQAMIFIVTLFIGGATWLTTAQLMLNRNTEDIAVLKTDNENLRDVVVRIDKNLAEISAVLKAKQHSIGD